jgi:hypothetical protein
MRTYCTDILRRDSTRLHSRSCRALGHVVCNWLSRGCRASMMKALKWRAVTSPSEHFTSLESLTVSNEPPPSSCRSKFGWGARKRGVTSERDEGRVMHFLPRLTNPSLGWLRTTTNVIRHHAGKKNHCTTREISLLTGCPRYPKTSLKRGLPCRARDLARSYSRLHTCARPARSTTHESSNLGARVLEEVQQGEKKIGSRRQKRCLGRTRWCDWGN